MADIIDMRAVIGPSGSSGSMNSGEVSGEFFFVLRGVLNSGTCTGVNFTGAV